jgi:hypothetical protein
MNALAVAEELGVEHDTVLYMKEPPVATRWNTLSPSWKIR